MVSSRYLAKVCKRPLVSVRCSVVKSGPVGLPGCNYPILSLLKSFYFGAASGAKPFRRPRFARQS